MTTVPIQYKENCKQNASVAGSVFRNTFSQPCLQSSKTATSREEAAQSVRGQYVALRRNRCRGLTELKLRARQLPCIHAQTSQECP